MASVLLFHEQLTEKKMVTVKQIHQYQKIREENKSHWKHFLQEIINFSIFLGIYISTLGK